MIFLIHAGFPKTGSTAIQRFFCKNRELFLKEFSILYPETGLISPYSDDLPDAFKYGHHLVTLVFKRPLQIWKLVYEYVPNMTLSVNDLITQLKREISLSSPAFVILSSECISIVPFYFIKEFFRYFSCNKVFVVYIRRQDLWLESFYREVIKLGEPVGDILSFSKDISCYVDYFTKFNVLSTFFPDSKLVVRVYDISLFPKGNIVFDFQAFVLAETGISLPLVSKVDYKENKSLSVISSLTLLKLLKSRVLDRSVLNKAVRFLLTLDGTREESGLIKSFLSLEERLEFLSFFSHGNNRVFSIYLNSFNMFTLSKDEIEFYKEQDHLRKEKLEYFVDLWFRDLYRFLSSM